MKLPAVVLVIFLFVADAAIVFKHKNKPTEPAAHTPFKRQESADGSDQAESSDAPSDMPSDAPSDMPSDMPSDVPSDMPSDAPSIAPTTSGTTTNPPAEENGDIDDDDDDDTAAAATTMFVEIAVGCVGVDFHKLGLQAAGLSSSALQETYNRVHQKTDNGDSYLSMTCFDHAFRRNSHHHHHHHQTFAAGLRGNEKKQDNGLFGYCMFCSYWGAWESKWTCRDCRDDDDDDDAVGGGGVSGIALRAWEAAFTEALLVSKHTEFANAQSCSIEIHAKSMADDY